ncbi:MAG TPA: hypothetical protein VFA27_08905 [Vicinamibacterales bacterium]|nr:hypothetical protein [Vicinamibacterales bacterium]
MAFDYADTDAFYKQLLKPAIRSTGARAVRVIDVNHNDDIDDKILHVRLCRPGGDDFTSADVIASRLPA